MKSPNNVETEPWLDISCHQRKLPVTGLKLGYLWGPMGNVQTTQAVAKTTGCSSQTDGKVCHWWRQHPHNSRAAAYEELSSSSIFGIGRCSAHPRKRGKCIQQPSHKCFDLLLCSTCKISLCDGITKQYLIWLEAHSTRTHIQTS